MAGVRVRVERSSSDRRGCTLARVVGVKVRSDRDALGCTFARSLLVPVPATVLSSTLGRRPPACPGRSVHQEPGPQGPRSRALAARQRAEAVPLSLGLAGRPRPKSPHRAGDSRDRGAQWGPVMTQLAKRVSATVNACPGHSGPAGPEYAAAGLEVPRTRAAAGPGPAAGRSPGSAEQARSLGRRPGFGRCAVPREAGWDTVVRVQNERLHIDTEAQ